MSARLRARLRSDAGFTVAEVVVAFLLVLFGATAVMSVVSGATRGTFRAEQSQVLISQLQDELEQVKRLDFDQVALTATPSSSSDPESPASRVSGNAFDINDTASGGAAQLVTNGSGLEGGGSVQGGQVDPGPTSFTSGDVEGRIFRYVVWLDDPTCPEALCPGSQDLKRVIVAADLETTTSGGARAYQELHTDLSDPDALPVDNPTGGSNGGGGDPGTTYPWTFWLTDTACNNSTRQPITADHATHKTSGTCTNTDKPDLMFFEAPELDSNFPPGNQPTYDYATDVEPATGGSSDKGLQMVRPSSLTNGLGCTLNLPTLEASPERKIHRWVSPPIPAGVPGSLALTGEGALHLWTQSLNSAKHAGRICIWLFRRQLNVLGQPVDTPLVNLSPPLTGLAHHEYYRDCSPATDAECWPRGRWDRLDIPLDFALDVNGSAVSLAPDSRIGLAIGVERAGTGADALQFMYDHPSFDSRLVLSANSVLPFG